MENKSHALVAGLFTIALLTAAIALGMWFYRDQVDWVPYEIATDQSIPGLNPQAEVRYRGLDVGRVESIGFDPRVQGQILIRISVRPTTPVTHSTYAMLGYQGVTGIAYVQLNDDGSSNRPLPSSEEDPARITMRPSLLDQLQQRGLAIMEQTEEVARRLNTLLGNQNQQAILAAFDNVSRAARALERVPEQIEPTLARLPGLATQAQRTLDSLDALAGQTRELTVNLNGMVSDLRAPEGAINTVTAAADRIGSVAAELEHETLPVASDIRSSLRALTRTLDRISERPESVLFGAPDIPPGPGEPGFAPPR